MKFRKFYLILIIVFSTLLVAAGGVFTLAWLSPYGKVVTEDGDLSYARLGMKLDLLFDMINSDSTSVADGTNLGIVSTDYDILDTYTVTTETTASGTIATVKDENGYYIYRIENYNATEKKGDACYYLYDSHLSWGTANNPYIISNVRHVQNLSILQKIGYFFDLYVSEYYKDGTYQYNGEDCMPYFLVCKPNGKPVTIEGGNIKFSPIGTDTYPFIGYVGGSFVSDSTTVDDLSCDQSVIKDINITTTEDLVDVGFFGAIGYLRNESEDPEEDGSFKGYVSTVRDFLLYDVTITVEQETIVDILGEFADHLFSFSATESVNPEGGYTVPHENHHFGILAGHVEYATVKYISVYYSDTETAAIDVSHIVAESGKMKANYYSVCGIIGYIDHMNAGTGDGFIENGGVTNEDVAVSNGGIGTGGGEISGTGRGYVTAASLCNNYYTTDDSEKGTKATRENVTSTNKNGQEVWEFYKITDPEEGTVSETAEYGIMIDKSGDYYTLHDHSDISVTIEEDDGTAHVHYDPNDAKKFDRWPTYIVCETSVDSSTNTTSKVYTANDGSALSSFRMINLVIRYGVSLENGTDLCTEYIRNRILWGTASTNMFYFYDGVFTFALSDGSDVIEDTWDNDTADSITVGEDDASKWTTDASGQSNAVVAFAKQVTQQSQLSEGKKLFIAYKDSAGNYHLVTLAANSSYNYGQQDDAITTPATELSLVDTEMRTQLKAALDAGALTLDDSADDDSGVLITQEKLKEEWDSIDIFNVGAATGTDLKELKSKYQITSTWEAPTTVKIYEDDRRTEATEYLKTNAQAVEKNCYLINSTIDTDITVTSGTKTYDYFNLGGTLTPVDEDDLSDAITAQNEIYYEDDWTTKTTDTSSPLAKKLTIGQQITQNEYHYYDDGYFYFYTYDTHLFWCSYKYFYVDSNGTVSEIGTKTGVSDNSSLSGVYSFFSSSSSDGYTTVYTKSVKSGKTTVTYSGPLLYELEGSYYEAFRRNTSSDDWITGTTEATIIDKKYCKMYTASYNYIVATLNGSGISYTFNGTSTACSAVTKTDNKVASRGNLNRGIYSTETCYKDYSLYSCTVGGVQKKGILITHYQLDGYSLKSLTGAGIKYYLNGITELSGKGVLTSGTLPELPTGMTSPGCTLSLGGNSYVLYTVDSKLVVRIANYAVKGYFLATELDSGTNFTLNAEIQQTEVEQFIKDASGTPLTISLSNDKDGTTTRNYNLYSSAQGNLAILLITSDYKNGTYQFWHKNVTDKDPTGVDDPFVLRLLRRAYLASYYSVMVGTDEYAGDPENFIGISRPTVSNSTSAKITFNTDGSVYISYTLNGHERFLRYDETNDHFDTAESSSATGAKLYIFTVEGTHDTTISDRIIPLAGTGKGTYAADEYILYPQSTLTGDDTANNTSDDPVYELLSLYELYQQDTGWKNSQGQQLSNSDLHKRFSLAEGIEWGITLNAFNGSWNFGSGSLFNGTSIVAPIGTNGEEANIPKGCIAFKINDSSQTEYGIRVVVSIPVSAYSPDDEDYELTTGEDYYFGIWHTEEAGTSLLQSFLKTNALEKFELPRSHPYELGADPADSEYITVKMGGKQYRAYLHGDQILVAYKFTVEEAGVYVLGATNGPMQIVYFSADSTASSGRDGTSSYKLGTIDFVYDYGDKIATVKDADTTGGTTENYEYYYPTLCLLSTSNGATPVDGDSDTDSYTQSGTSYNYPNINYFKLYVRRQISDSEGSEAAEIQYRISSDIKEGMAETYSYDKNYLPFVRYALNADELKIIASNQSGSDSSE